MALLGDSFVLEQAAGPFERTFARVRGPNPLSAVCARVCGTPCGSLCRRGGPEDAQGSLQPFVRERFRSPARRRWAARVLEGCIASEGAPPSPADVGRPPPDLKQFPGVAAHRRSRVAVVGAGPAGLACAHDLALMGLRSTVCEAEAEPAGMLMYGIPEDRLPRRLVLAEVALIQALGVTFRCSTAVGRDVGFGELIDGYDAVVIAVGARSSRLAPLTGVHGPDVLGAVEFLRQVARCGSGTRVGGRVVVVGSGHTAWDAARTAMRLGREPGARGGPHAVTLVSPRPRAGGDGEAGLRDLEALGVHCLSSWGAERIERDAGGRVSGVLFNRCRNGRRSGGGPAAELDPNIVTRLEADTVILALGRTPDPSFIDGGRDGVALDEAGCISSDPETQATTRPGVFVAGEAATGPGLLLQAVASGKMAARQVRTYLGLRQLRQRSHVPTAAL